MKQTLKYLNIASAVDKIPKVTALMSVGVIRLNVAIEI
jgi:hypothetical protein